jgi:hypothetical protein
MLSRIVSRCFTFPLLLFLLPRIGSALTPPEAPAPGPDVILGDLPALFQAGSNGTQVGLMMATDICNNGNVPVNWFQVPETDHPVIPQNLYRLSGGANNAERFEQIGQSWVKHAFVPLQQNACGFGCIASPDSAHLGVGCSTADSASANAIQSGLGSRAWVNPYTGIFPSTANSHTGHTHDGTAHRILVEANDLNTAMNPGATYYGEAQLVSPQEYAWCAAHPGECNMYNNVSYRQFAVAGTTNFSFSAVGDTVRTTPAIFAWPGATIQTIEPAQGVDGKAFLAYKVTQVGKFLFHYEYAIYNQNLDRGIQSFSVPAGCGIGSAFNVGFRAPLNHPGAANDGTAGDAGYSNVPWSMSIGPTVYWYSETLAQNPNANALRWGTLYNFRFDGGPPNIGTGVIAFFKTGDFATVSVPGPAPECAPSPSPPPPPTPTPSTSPTPTATPTFTPAITPTPTATPTATPSSTSTPSSTPTATPNATPTPSPMPSPPSYAVNLSTRMRVETGDRVGIGGFIITGTPKYVLIRAIGPSLTGLGVPDALADPILELHGPGAFPTITNRNWRDTQEQEIQNTGIPPTNNLESAIVTHLGPGAYTAIVRGKGNTSGVALVEVYDLDPQGVKSRLANLSTRAFAGTGDSIVIAGFILGGSDAPEAGERIVLRGLGPSLAAGGVSDVLADPTLEVREGNGTLILANNNWQDNPNQAKRLTAAGLAPTNNLEAAMIATLPRGAYTVLLTGLNNGTGIGLIEVYDLGPP